LVIIRGIFIHFCEQEVLEILNAAVNIIRLERSIRRERDATDSDSIKFNLIPTEADKTRETEVDGLDY